MNKTLMQFRTTAEPIFILTKWGAEKKIASQFKRNVASLDSKKISA